MRSTTCALACVAVLFAALSVFAVDHVYRDEDIVLTEKQRMTIESVVYHLAGSIFLYDEARLVIRDATMVFSSAEPNIWGDVGEIRLRDSSALEITNSTILIRSTGSYRPRMWVNVRDSAFLLMADVAADHTKVFAKPGSTFTATSVSIAEASISDTSTTSLTDVSAGGITIEFWGGEQQELSNIHPGRDISLKLLSTAKTHNELPYLSAEGVATESIGVFVAGDTHLTVYNSVLDAVSLCLENPTGRIDGLEHGHFDDWDFLRSNPVDATCNVTLLDTDVTCCMGLAIDGGNRPLEVVNCDLLSIQIWDYHGELSIHDTEIVGFKIYDSTISLDFTGSTLQHGLDIERSAMFIPGGATFDPEAMIRQWIESSLMRKFEIRVLSPEGTPATGASVEVIDPDGASATYMCDADGLLTLWKAFNDESAHEGFRLLASAAGGEIAEHNLQPLSSSPVTIRLQQE